MQEWHDGRTSSHLTLRALQFLQPVRVFLCGRFGWYVLGDGEAAWSSGDSEDDIVKSVGDLFNRIVAATRSVGVCGEIVAVAVAVACGG